MDHSLVTLQERETELWDQIETQTATIYQTKLLVASQEDELRNLEVKLEQVQKGLAAVVVRADATGEQGGGEGDDSPSEQRVAAGEE